MKGRPTAWWNMELLCKCPYCKRVVDLWSDNPDLNPGEPHDNHPFECPHCEKEFNADVRY